MKHFILMSFFLLFTSCAIEEIEGIPSLNPPLGLVAVRADNGGIVLYFSAYNRETFFYGYSVFISPREEDFKHAVDGVFGVDPRNVSGSQAQLLTNTGVSAATETEITMKKFIMSSVPEGAFIYPEHSVGVGAVDPSDSRVTNFTTSPVTALPNGGAFAGTYYVAAFAYAALNDDGQRFSLPSNIYKVTF